MSAPHLHLISDSTGETLTSVVKASLAQFEGAEANKHLWSLVRNERQMGEVFNHIRQDPGLVLYTIVNVNLRRKLQDWCEQHHIPCVSVLDPVLGAMAKFLGIEVSGQPGQQHVLDAAYYKRIEAMHFTMAHDDGHLIEELNAADIVLLGVSRTSKTPTCIYLANQGLKAANVPMVPNITPPDELNNLTRPFVVGLTKNHRQLAQIRRNRLRSLNENQGSDYADPDSVKRELQNARRFYTEHNWPVIDVSRRSIEETAAAILNLYHQKNSEEEEKGEEMKGAN